MNPKRERERDMSELDLRDPRERAQGFI